MANMKIAQAVGGVGRLVRDPIRVTSDDNMVAVCRIPGNLGMSGNSALESCTGRDDDDPEDGFRIRV